MNRVSIRTLVLTTELFVIFLAYQYLESMSPATSPGATCAVKLDDTGQEPAGANVSEALATPAGDPPWRTDDDTPALQHAVTVPETEQLWHIERSSDPNDRVEPDGSEPAPEDIE